MSRRMISVTLLSLLALVVGLAPGAFARTAGTPHDFRSPAKGGRNTKFANLAAIAGDNPCRVCHPSFHVGQGQQYMWGDDYGWQPTKEISLPQSVFCAGCHDGKIVTKTGTDIIPDAAMMVRNHKHPVEAVYPVGRAAFRTATEEAEGRWTVQAPGGVRLPLYAAEDETPRFTCLTCHNPHELGREGLFLRTADKSELCAACHTKTG